MNDMEVISAPCMLLKTDSTRHVGNDNMMRKSTASVRYTRGTVSIERRVICSHRSMDINVMMEVVVGIKYVAEALAIATTFGLTSELDRFISSIAA